MRSKVWQAKYLKWKGGGGTLHDTYTRIYSNDVIHTSDGGRALATIIGVSFLLGIRSWMLTG